VPLAVHDCGRIGTTLEVTIRDEAGNEAAVSWEGPLQQAEKHPLTVAAVRETFGRLGETPFELRAVELNVPEPVLVPKSVLNDLRRRAVTLLQERREAAVRHTAAEPAALEHLRAEIRSAHPIPTEAPTPSLYVLARTLEQLDAVLAWRLDTPLSRPALVYCDFEDPRRYAEAVARARAAGVPIGLASLRIVKPGEEGFLHTVARHGADALLVRNLAALTLYRDLSPRPTLVGDFSLNVANELTADLLAGAGLARLVPSYDLNWDQLGRHARPHRPVAIRGSDPSARANVSLN
jgi:U32 family peptidase